MYPAKDLEQHRPLEQLETLRKSKLQFCDLLNALLQHIRLPWVWLSDEAHFHISGYVNKQNMRYWSGIYPREVHERPLHSDRVTVWAAISRVGIIKQNTNKR
ncbi:hypothetical protein Trydic_g19271 [Trypoxylus dichotomus]